MNTKKSEMTTADNNSNTSKTSSASGASSKKQFLLRIDANLWGELEKWSQDELRSINGQIEYILKEALNKRYNKKREDR